MAAELPAGPTTKDKTNEYSVRTVVETCTAKDAERCVIDTLITAKQLVNQDLVWERRIYFQHYDLTQPIEKQAIGIKSIKLVRGKSLMVKNARGDSFELELGHGHMKRPKNPREYTK